MLAQLSAYAEVESYIDIPDFQYEGQNLNQTDPLITIEPVTYKVREDATYCIRPIEMIDTIVFHHSETRNTDTAQDINAYHLLRGSPTDPWYMIAYSFAINAPYIGQKTPKAKVSFGRPLKIVGAHAGSNVFIPMTEEQQRIWDSGKIKCGRTNNWVYDPSLVKDGKIKANVTTIGVVIIGNYAKFSGKYIKKGRKTVLNPTPNLNGFLPAKEPSDEVLDQFARLACQMQRENPTIKKFAYHGQYHSTSCPGTIDKHMTAIQLKAKEYGCDFKVIPGKFF